MTMPEKDKPLRSLLIQGLERRLYTAASVIVGIDGRPIEEHHVGFTAEQGAHISPFHYFDLASLTKPIVTASLYMKEVQSGNIRLEDRLERFIPAKWIGRSFRGSTIDQILSHRAGFPACANLFESLIYLATDRRKEEYVKNILSSSRESKPVYSDLGYIILGYVLETIHNRRLDELFNSFRKSFRDPHLSFLPFEIPRNPSSPPVHYTVPPAAVSTGLCRWRKRFLRAEVHDCNCYCLGGISGHAGLFGTSRAVFSWVSKLWKAFTGQTDNGKDSGFSPDTIRKFFEKPDNSSGWTRGFDTPTPGNSIVSPYFSADSVGHYGFTGTSFWLDLRDGFMVVLLTNRVYYETDQKIFRDFRIAVHSTARRLLG